MLTVIYAHKAGQGVTTITATLATLTARAGHRTLLIDTGTDLPAVLGIAEPDRPGLGDYLADTTITLADIVTPVTENLDLITRDNHAPERTAANYGLLTGALDRYDTVIIDTAPDATDWVRLADTRVLVTRPCFLALRNATSHPRPDYLVVVTEHGRALTPADIETVIGIPITATIPHAPDISRAVDAGVLTTRPPRSLPRPSPPSPPPSPSPDRSPDEHADRPHTRPDNRPHHHHRRLQPRPPTSTSPTRPTPCERLNERTLLVDHWNRPTPHSPD